jgi:membrane protease YdiL (CAAX protease family)
MMPTEPGGDERDEVFWHYRDLLIFALLSVPCLITAALFSRVLGGAVPQIGVSKTWIAMLLFYVLWFGALYVLLYTGYRRPFWFSLGWRYPIAGKWFAAAGGPVLAMLVGMLGTLFRTPVIETSLKKLIQDRLSLVLFGIFSMIIGPVCEELAFRGFLMPLLVRSFGPVAGIVGAAVPFALLHGDQYSWTWQYIVLVALAGVVFGWVRYRTGSTMASALMHSTYNATFYAAYVIGGAKI